MIKKLEDCPKKIAYCWIGSDGKEYARSDNGLFAEIGEINTLYWKIK